ncbi:prepilin-type N-terminal cleavage/methylation domain-containing protein [Candidatus Saccharibacteria bacterium]|nr:prepilin-type N-terminal cleavage/methylation domain-containing protein [Candidatus Saccharibacteria bacterium]
MSTKQSGFTIIELLTTIIVAALFVGVFYQMFVILVGVNANARNVAQASNLAYSNMRRYPTAASTGLTCSASSTNLLNTTGVDSDYSELGSVTETVTASYPYGCSAVYDVIKLVSVVTYRGATKVSYATYVN